MIALLLLLLTAMPVWATDYYFDPVGGNDANPCTEAQPCKTDAAVQAKLDARSASDRFFFKRGTTMLVNPVLLISGTPGGTQANPLLLDAYGTGAHPILDSTAVGGAYTLTCSNVAWITIRNLEIRAAKGIIFAGCTNFVLTGMRFTGDFVNEVVRIKKSSTGADSANGRLAENVWNLTDASEYIYLGTDIAQGGEDFPHDITIEDNEFDGNTTNVGGEAIEAKAGVYNLTIRRNYFHHTNRGTNSNGLLFSSMGTLTTYPFCNCVVAYNWIENTTGTQAHALEYRNSLNAYGNIIINNAQHGVNLTDPNNLDFTRTVTYNTFYANAGASINDTGGDNDTKANNVAWANGSVNDASNPLFVDAAARNFRLQAGSPALTRGALRAVTPTAATILANGTSVRVTSTLAVPPVQSCTAAGFALTCSPAGSQTAVSCTPDGTTDVLLGLATAVQQGATCTLDIAATSLLDDARIGGIFAPVSTNSGTNYAVNALAMTNTSTVGQTEANLLTVTNMVPGTCPECASNRPWSVLLDLDMASENGSAGNHTITSFSGEHDLGTLAELATFSAWCDVIGIWNTQHVTFEYKVNSGDAYTVGVNHQVCNANQWFLFPLGNVSGRYVRITFFCETACDGTQAREIHLAGTPGELPLPGTRTITRRGLIARKGGVAR
jgi:hypothetical protein